MPKIHIDPSLSLKELRRKYGHRAPYYRDMSRDEYATFIRDYLFKQFIWALCNRHREPAKSRRDAFHRLRKTWGLHRAPCIRFKITSPEQSEEKRQP